MTDSAWFALTVAVVGGAGGFAGSWLSTWMSLRSQARSRRHEQQQRDGAVVGAVLDHLDSADPRRLAGRTPDPDLRSRELRDLEWRQGELRLQLQVLAAGHPDGEVTDTARDLATALHSSFASTAMAVHGVGTPNDRALLETAAVDHAAARELAEELLDKTRRYARRR